ncbi:hypothetical protein THIOKS13070009 [Thiocapsa sp. KS1]|nr:hypothetical protein [Thiocapsa sp. KS1]CRI66753.1 hypothetical protein THIOKS13070009 [Thiocapsa sp. KS1]
MSELTIEMSLDNAAFEDDPAPEIARILRQLADKLEGRGIDDEILLRDINGNRVGKAVIVMDNDD